MERDPRAAYGQGAAAAAALLVGGGGLAMRRTLRAPHTTQAHAHTRACMQCVVTPLQPLWRALRFGLAEKSGILRVFKVYWRPQLILGISQLFKTYHHE